MPVSSVSAFSSLGKSLSAVRSLTFGERACQAGAVAVALAVAVAARDGTMTLAGSLPVFIALLIVYLRAFSLGTHGRSTAHRTQRVPLAITASRLPSSPPSAAVARGVSLANGALLSVALVCTRRRCSVRARALFHDPAPWALHPEPAP